MGRHIGRVDPYARRLPPGNAEPQDAWMPVSERRELERINEKFLMLLKQEKLAKLLNLPTKNKDATD